MTPSHDLNRIETVIEGQDIEINRAIVAGECIIPPETSRFHGRRIELALAQMDSKKKGKRGFDEATVSELAREITGNTSGDVDQQPPEMDLSDEQVALVESSPGTLDIEDDFLAGILDHTKTAALPLNQFVAPPSRELDMDNQATPVARSDPSGGSDGSGVQSKSTLRQLIGEIDGIHDDSVDEGGV